MKRMYVFVLAMMLAFSGVYAGWRNATPVRAANTGIHAAKYFSTCFLTDQTAQGLEDAMNAWLATQTGIFVERSTITDACGLSLGVFYGRSGQRPVMTRVKILTSASGEVFGDPFHDVMNQFLSGVGRVVDLSDILENNSQPYHLAVLYEP